MDEKITEEERSIVVETAYGTAELEVTSDPERAATKFSGDWLGLSPDVQREYLARRVSRLLAAWAEIE